MRAFVNCWPDMRLRPEVAKWLFVDAGIKADDMEFYSCRQPYFCSAMNQTMKRALDSDADEYLFVESDMLPTAASLPVLEASGDVVCCTYPTKGGDCWGSDAFHTGLWRTSRSLLGSVGAPWFVPVFNHDYTELLKCECAPFRDKVILSGHSIVQAGTCGHDHETTRHFD